MIGKLVAPLLKLLLPKVTQAVTEHLAKIFKMDQLLQYMEMPNDADKKVEKLEVKMRILMDDVKKLEASKEKFGKVLKKIGK
tara:strand:- start:238 stop:483 length:246 start_codon:yes stop_codon:yes gene_type:complete